MHDDRSGTPVPWLGTPIGRGRLSRIVILLLGGFVLVGLVVVAATGATASVDGELPEIDDDDIVVNEDGEVVSGASVDSEEVIAIPETAGGSALLVDNSEQVVSLGGDRIRTANETAIDRFAEESPDIRVSEDPFDALVLSDGVIETESGTPVVDDDGNQIETSAESSVDIEILTINDPDEGEDLDVVVAVENTDLGDADEQITVTAGPLSATETVEVAGFDSVLLEFTFEDIDALGDTTVTATNRDGSATDSWDIYVGPARVLLTDHEVVDSVEVGETLEVSAEFTRFGAVDNGDSVDVKFRVDGTVVANKLVSVESGESVTESFTYEVREADMPELDYRIELTDPEIDAQTVGPETVDVLGPDFRVKIVDVLDPVPRGGSAPVTAEVENVGETIGQQELELSADESGQFSIGSDWRLHDTETVALLPNDSQDVTFEYAPDDVSPEIERIDFRVRSNQSDAEYTASIDDIGPLIDATVTNVTTAVQPGGTLAVATELENPHGGPGRAPVHLFVDVSGADAPSRWEHQDSLNIEWSHRQWRAETFRYTVPEDIDRDTIEVELRTNAVIRSETVSIAESETDIVSFKADPPRVAPGETFSLVTTVENTGTTDTPILEVFQNGTQVDSERLTVDSGETGTGTFSLTAPDAPGEYKYELTGAGGAITTLTVEGTADSDAGDEGGSEGHVEIANATVNETSIAPGDAIRVDADVVNTGQETATYDVTLELDGASTQTRTLEAVPPDGTEPVEFVQTLDEPGTVTVDVSGTRAGVVTVGDEEETDDGGAGDGDESDADEPDANEPGDEDETGLLGGLLGVLPLGLFRMLLVYLGVPLLIIYLFLKGLAYYLGY